MRNRPENNSQRIRPSNANEMPVSIQLRSEHTPLLSKKAVQQLLRRANYIYYTRNLSSGFFHGQHPTDHIYRYTLPNDPNMYENDPEQKTARDYGLIPTRTRVKKTKSDKWPSSNPFTNEWLPSPSRFPTVISPVDKLNVRTHPNWQWNEQPHNYQSPTDLDILFNLFSNQENSEKREKYTEPDSQPPLPLVIVKERRQIDTPIRCIKDLLQIVHDCPDDPSIQYNIDVSALHKMKTSLMALDGMVGMSEVKNDVLDQLLYLLQGLHKSSTGTGDYLHTVLYGPPGTGKTELAKILGKMYSQIGILSKGTFRKVTRSDLIGGYMGQTTLKTREVIHDALGGVLFIDEAYSIGDKEDKDRYSDECIDTLCESLSNYKDDLMVIIAGYEKEMKERFFKHNQGLESRFAWRFHTDKYTYRDLYLIFLKKVDEIGWSLMEEVSDSWFKKNYEHFAYYGRDVETLLSKTKVAHSRRVMGLSEECRRKLSLEDMNKGLQQFLKHSMTTHNREEQQMKKYVHDIMYT